MAELKPKISVYYSEDATVITLAEERILEDADIKGLEESIMPIIEQAGRINLILDFCNVEFLSSAVLGLLIRISKKVYQQDGQLKLCGIDEKIYKIFKITRLNKIFDIYEDLSKARQSLK